MKISDAQRTELERVYSRETDSVHEYDREPLWWVRFVNLSTIKALHHKGLCGRWQYDYPVGGYRARLTDTGYALRRDLLTAIR